MTVPAYAREAATVLSSQRRQELLSDALRRVGILKSDANQHGAGFVRMWTRSSECKHDLSQPLLAETPQLSGTLEFEAIWLHPPACARLATGIQVLNRLQRHAGLQAPGKNMPKSLELYPVAAGVLPKNLSKSWASLSGGVWYRFATGI